ncbi:MAG: ATP-binding cassette domain-containing protein [Gemmatimonadaceae bacterium]|nr:ATP-binding cassette domain-containing protein [Gemmatimonadaceae bacterium]
MTREPVSIIAELAQVTRRFGSTLALDAVSLRIPRGVVIGLVGKNGSGKTTLLNHLSGLLLPTSGTCRTFGVPSGSLGAAELSRIGAMWQHSRLVAWMSVGRLIRYVGGFYERWDRELVGALIARLRLDVDARVGGLSPGRLQQLSLVLALGHHPELLLLDEPLSDLDPSARQEVLTILLEVYAAEQPTIVVSSHLLHDIEPVITHVVALDAGRVTCDAELDTLKERYVAWKVAARGQPLPSTWDAPFIVSAAGDAHQATLVVERDASSAAQFAALYDVELVEQSLNLEGLFPVVTSARGPRARATVEVG